MLLSATEAIYSGNLPVKKLHIDNKLTYKPKVFSFCSIIKPLVIEISNAGITNVNGVWYLMANKTSYEKPGTVSTYGFLSPNVAVSGWDIVIGRFGGTTYYRVSGLNPIPSIPPLTGWVSLNNSYDPTPTLSYNNPLSAVYEVFLSNIQQVNLNISPTLSSNKDYYFDNVDTFFGVSSSTQFANVTSISNLDDSLYSNFDFDYFPNISNISMLRSSRVVFNNSKLQSLVTSNIKTTDIFYIYNNLNLLDVILGASYFTSNTFNTNPRISSFSVNTNPQLTDFNLTPYSNLRNLSIINTPNLTSLQTLSSYPNFQNLTLTTNALTGYTFLDTFLLGMSSKPNPTYVHDGTFAKRLGRSNVSNAAFLEVFKKNQNITYEIDPVFPLQTIPTSYYPSTHNEIVVSCPVSANNTNFIQHTTLSGIYTKVNNVTYNNRDVFRNINDFFILYDNNNTRWTLIGPTSGSSTIWLSAQDVIGDNGNIPSIGWNGIAFKLGFGTSSPGTNNSGWWNQTAVFDTRMYLFSSFMYAGTNVRRIGGYPLSGFNSNFYWSAYNFSGIGYQNVSDPMFNGRWTLISPVHYINTFHFPESLSIGAKINFIHKDRSISTRTVLSAVNLPNSGTNDLRIGILDAPLSAAAYPIGSLTNFITAISSTIDFNNFLYGPVGTGKVGIGIPSTYYNDCRYYVAPTTYTQITSVPKSLWFTENVYVGDSSAQFWYTDPIRKQLVILGITKFSIPSGPALLDRYYTTLYNTATALCKQFYGDPLMYQLTAYNF